jgi:rare lipoprotein A
MAGAHATLQLPAVARVTNLENGLQALIRINDRGPASPGRLIGLTPHAADRLGMRPGAATRVRVQVESEPSQALRDLLQGGPAVAVASAPRGQVSSEELAPPPGLRRSTLRRVAFAPQPTANSHAPVVVEQRGLSDTVVRVPVSFGQLWLRAAEFGQAVYADRLQARLAGLGASVERVRRGPVETFRVRAGPFTDVGQADAALDLAIKAGVTDAHIVVD